MSILKEVNILEVQQKLYERLKPSGWADKLKSFLLSDDFTKILTFLLDDVQNGKRFTPVLKQVFRAFEECPFEDLKIVMISQDPYPQKNVADGISFSCSNTGKPETSLKYIFKEIERTVYKNGYIGDPDLKRWSNQGILMLNTAFTTTITKVGTHYQIWKPFMEFLFDVIGHQKSSLIYVFLGKKAQEWMDSVPMGNQLLITSHPASASYNYSEIWESGDIFPKISHHVKEKFGVDIIW